MALTLEQLNNCEPSKKQKNTIETPVAEEVATTAVNDQEEQTVHLEFPYDDLELLYKYTLKKMGIKDPFK
ncbi:MAG: hypothetical protein ACN4A7_04620 [Thermacetogeniaceae bacterium]|jgi:hypothetical protein|nr:hypothetical protein [Thermoanaerobacterales bacterium]NLN21427.1 hypothetical protein [Syntrophomonadaceae bacterium]